MIEVPVTHTGSKSRQERIQAREAAFRDYFQSARLRQWSLAKLGVERWPFSAAEAQRALGLESLSVLLWEDLKDSLVSCCVGGHLAGLGIVHELSGETISIWTPVEHATTIQWGSLKVFPDGRHLRQRGSRAASAEE